MVILGTELTSQLTVYKLVISAYLYSPSISNLSFFMLAVYCDELITDVDRQLLRWKMLHIQINDVTILFHAHLYRQYNY